HQLQSLTERVHGSELKSYERKLQLSALLERSGSELGLVEDVLLAEYGPDQLIPVAAARPAAPEPDAQPEAELTLEEQLEAELGLRDDAAADAPDAAVAT